ncbi:ABC transporter permease [Rhabdothermincola sediminis]|uniref:ABC transporter permease n=1 Tax=Rhabdothermincola sediminis TaxID=2751370 RepID=UPI001AA0AD54|nr:iron ABC transporter permease [Rhabdothermincola sediminis]
MILRRLGRLLLVGVPLAFLAIFFAYPVVAIVLRGLRPAGQWDLGVVGEVLGEPALRRVVWFTAWQAAVSTLLTVVVAMPAAWCFARLEFRGKRLLWAGLIVPFVLPTVVVGAAFLGLVGPRSPLGVDLRGTVWAILLAHVFFNYAVVVRTVGGLWMHLDPHLEEAARVLGAGWWQSFRRVTWPLLRPAVAAAASIVFLFTFTSFGVVLILGGPRYRTLEVEIYTQTARLLNLDTAAVLALVQLVAVVAVLFVYARYQERRSVSQLLRPATETARPLAGWRDRALLGANLAVIAVLLVAPLAVLVGRSLSTPGGWGLDAYRALDTSRRGSVLFVAPLEAVRNSLLFAGAATLIALVVGTMAAFAIAGRDPARTARWIDTLLMIPLGTSAVTVGFGFLIALDRPPLDLRDSLVLLPIAHALVAVPFVIRLLVPTLRSIDPRLREAAAVLGARPARVWREVDLPLVGRALLAAAGFAFAVSLGEFGATVFLARSQWPTLPIAIYRFLGQPGPLNFAQAAALSTILMGLTVAVMLAIERVRVGRIGEF